jgi:hypothetical protein
MGRTRTKAQRPEPKPEKKLLQTRISEEADALLQNRLARTQTTAAVYLRRLVLVDLGIISAEDR